MKFCLNGIYFWFIFKERGVAVAALGSFVGAVAFPGTFILDQVVAVTFIAHGYWGVDHMIGDYVPLLAPVAVAKVNFIYGGSQI